MKSPVCFSAHADLLGSVFDGLRSEGGVASLIAMLGRMTDGVVAELSPRVEPLPLEQRMDVLRLIYGQQDLYSEVEQRGDDFVLTERNCPYSGVVTRTPEICSVTVSALRRLTGCQVTRVRRMQDGGGRCEFHVQTASQSASQPPRFDFEPPPPMQER